MLTFTTLYTFFFKSRNGVIWRTGRDEPGAKWIDFGHIGFGGKWYNGHLNDYRTSNNFFISITCN